MKEATKSRGLRVVLREKSRSAVRNVLGHGFKVVRMPVRKNARTVTAVPGKTFRGTAVNRFALSLSDS